MASSLGVLSTHISFSIIKWSWDNHRNSRITPFIGPFNLGTRSLGKVSVSHSPLSIIMAVESILISLCLLCLALHAYSLKAKQTWCGRCVNVYHRQAEYATFLEYFSNIFLAMSKTLWDSKSIDNSHDTYRINRKKILSRHRLDSCGLYALLRL